MGADAIAGTSLLRRYTQPVMCMRVMLLDRLGHDTFAQRNPTEGEQC